MNRDEIREILPHREPMLLLDFAQQIDENTVEAYYDVKGDEYFLQGHFPGNPIVPGVIQCEIMAQSLCALMGEEARGKQTFYTGLDKVRFRRPVKPGERFSVRAQVTRRKGPFLFAAAEGRVDGELCVSCELSVCIR